MIDNILNFREISTEREVYKTKLYYECRDEAGLKQVQLEVINKIESGDYYMILSENGYLEVYHNSSQTLTFEPKNSVYNIKLVEHITDERWCPRKPNTPNITYERIGQHYSGASGGIR